MFLFGSSMKRVRLTWCYSPNFRNIPKMSNISYTGTVVVVVVVAGGGDSTH